MVGMMAEPLPEGMRLQRHGVPHLPADGVTPAEERPVPVARLSAGDLHQGGDRLGRREHDEVDVISRHFPAVAFAMEGIPDDNAFKPWKVKK